MSLLNTHWTIDRVKSFHKSVDNFNKAMEKHPDDEVGQVISIDFKSKKVIKEKCIEATKKEVA